MSKQFTMTATIPAWLTSTSSGLDRVMREAKENPADAISQLGYSVLDMDVGKYPWVRVGTAQITVTLMQVEDVVAAQVQALQRELQIERAESVVRQNAILDRIGKLQALTNEVAS